MITNEWHVSTASGGVGCVEVQYRTSSFCSGGDCVEVGLSSLGEVRVRDTKDRSLAPHSFTPAAWAAFTAGVRNREFS